ncbi:DUF4344 domain-containing metallopeptidase [Halodesulfovibrio marinisediminis]|uniref:Putative metallopeptidase n=1 Tax=Halodesulfovibrio marinisediminis DSM 17456 TaxID=1121457 RepID=A0A1N6GP70_9BACT|nr:DUF4344 domain-containing metallopeptidase [Halodesulfovibrio marinisediminis]SIO09340.1 Putative metallopeptidase [Halodesulfovibrio marinisediminis DSM 17456]
MILKKLFYTFIIWCVVIVDASMVFAAENVVSFQYGEAKHIEQAEARSEVVASGVAEQITNYMNAKFQFPASVQILFTDTAQEDPHYDSEAKTIVIPYSFWTECRERFKKEYSAGDTGNIVDTLCVGVLAHTVFHELGHAVVDICELPITGNEETVVDEFAILMLLDSFHDGREMALIAGDYFALEGKSLQEVTDGDLFDEHPLDDQRFFSTFCTAYGVAPDVELEKEMLELDISEERLDLCVADAERRVRAWGTLLKPFERL